MRHVVLFLLLLISRESLAEQWGLGPTELRNSYPLSQLHLSFAPGSPEISDQDEWTLQLQGSWSNTQNYRKKGYSVDAESRLMMLGVDYGAAEDLELSLELPLHWRGHGVLDSVIDGWHQFFGFPRGGREDIPENQFVIQGSDREGGSFELNTDGTALGNLTVGGETQISRGSEDSPALSVALGVSLPTATDAAFGHRGVDLLASGFGSKSFGDFVWYGGLGYLYYSAPEVNGFSYRQHQFAASNSLEYRFNSSISVNAGIIYYSALLENVARFPDFSLYVDTGIKYQMSKGWRLEALVRENPAPRKGTTDVTLLLGINYIFSDS